LTLETGGFLAAALRATGFGAAFLALTAAFVFEAVFFAERSLTGLRAGGLAVVARLAFGFEAAFALTARFAVFAVGFAFERDADRLKPFVRLLLMGGISKGCSLGASSRLERGRAYHRSPSKSMSTSICGCFKDLQTVSNSTKVQTKKNT